jgi:hypothetical protein
VIRRIAGPVLAVEDPVGERRLAVLVTLTLVLVAGCAAKMTPQQALVEEAFQSCQAQGPSTKLERVDRDGRFSVVGRESESQKVHDCMVRYAEPTRRASSPPSAPGTPSVASAPSAPPPPRAEALMASRLPGTWRGTLKLPPRGAGEAEVAGPATVRFAVAAGSLRWTLATSASSALVADGVAMVVDGELQMTGTMRASNRTNGEPTRSNITVRYAGVMVGDRLEVTGITTDKQVHVLSIRRVNE